MPKKAAKLSFDLTPGREELVARALRDIVPYERAIAVSSTKMRVLAFDPGIKNVAICFWDEEHKELLTSKVEYPPEITTKFGAMQYLEMTVRAWIRYYMPDLIIKEGPALGARFGVAQAGQIQYVIEREAYDWRVPFVTIGPTQVRSFLGTAGKNHGKSDTKLVVFKKWGLEFPSEDECDAFAALQAGLALARGTWKPKGKAK